MMAREAVSRKHRKWSMFTWWPRYMEAMYSCGQELGQNMKTVKWRCYVCLLPKCICWNPNAQCDGVRRWDPWRCLSLEGGDLQNGISALIKVVQRAPCSFGVWGHSEKELAEQGIGPPPEPDCWCLGLRLPSLQNGEWWIPVVYKPPISGIYYSNQNGLLQRVFYFQCHYCCFNIVCTK